jgi:hypothetical protein
MPDKNEDRSQNHDHNDHCHCENVHIPIRFQSGQKYTKTPFQRYQERGSMSDFSFFYKDFFFLYSFVSYKG